MEQVLPNGNPNLAALFVQPGSESGFNAGNFPGPSGPCSGRAVTFAQGRFRYPSYFNMDSAIIKNTTIPSFENAEVEIGFQLFFLQSSQFRRSGHLQFRLDVRSSLSDAKI